MAKKKKISRELNKKDIKKVEDIIEKMTNKKTSNGRLFVPGDKNTMICLECNKFVDKDSFDEHLECILAYEEKWPKYLTVEVWYQYIHENGQHKKCQDCQKAMADCIGVYYIAIPFATHEQREETVVSFFKELRNDGYPKTDQISVYCNPCSDKVNYKIFNNSTGYYITFIRKPKGDKMHN